ncbi:MAG: rod-binding protein [Myxococcales bacterium]|nr:rod-binding protein [Myxococcales bacterium]
MIEALAAARAESAGSDRAPSEGAARDAAQQFESLLVQQLFRVMRRSVPSMGGGRAGGMYLDMFDGALAQDLAKAGGVGLTPIFERALGGEPGASHTVRTGPLSLAAPLSHPFPIEPARTHGAPAAGATASLQAAASELLGSGAERWARDGSLQPQDLASNFATQEPGGIARFNVRDALGYHGYYKCNLFAFETARRAGFEVPVVGRPAGWGFPSADRVTGDAQDRELTGHWGHVVTGESAQDLDAAARGGGRAFMLTGSGHGEHRGHMALVERVHSIDYDEGGGLRRIVFDGWEARAEGAQHLQRRTWNRYGNPGGENARNGFEGIEIIELKRSTHGRAEVPISNGAGRSIRDASRSAPQHPSGIAEADR